MLYSETRQKIIARGELSAATSAAQIDKYFPHGVDTVELTCYTLDNMLRPVPCRLAGLCACRARGPRRVAVPKAPTLRELSAKLTEGVTPSVICFANATSLKEGGIACGLVRLQGARTSAR